MDFNSIKNVYKNMCKLIRISSNNTREVQIADHIQTQFYHIFSSLDDYQNKMCETVIT